MVLLLRPIRPFADTDSMPRFLLLLPIANCPLSGWRASAILVLDHLGRRELELTLYQRSDIPGEDFDGPQAA
jgi:hypothetical protein